MDSQEGNRKRPRQRKRLTYFFVNGELHRSLHVQRAADLIRAWNYPQHKMVGYSYTDVLKNHEKAYSTKDVCYMINRSRQRVEDAILSGKIKKPQKTYNINPDRPGKWESYRWSEEEVYDLHDYFLTVHRGRPRNDGLITPSGLPSKQELRAMMRQEVTLYIQNEEGKFVPTWAANH